MSTILENLLKSSTNINEKVTQLNLNFVKKYLDSDLIIKLIDIRKLYLDILKFDESKKKDTEIRNKLKSELDILNNQKKGYINKNFSLLKRKIAIVKNLTTNMDSKLLIEDSKINDEVNKNLEEIKKFNIEIDKKNNEINSLSCNHLDKDMLLNTLKYKISNTNIENLDYIDCNKKDEYQTEFLKIYQSDIISKCYTTYFFEIVALDIDNLKHAYNIAKIYVHNSYKQDNDRELENNSIFLELILNEEINNNLNSYLELADSKKLSNNTLNDITSEFLKHNSIYHNMSHFAKNYKELMGDYEIISSEYQMIKGFINDLKKELDDVLDEKSKIIIDNTINTFRLFSKNIGI